MKLPKKGKNCERSDHLPEVPVRELLGLLFHSYLNTQFKFDDVKISICVFWRKSPLDAAPVQHY